MCVINIHNDFIFVYISGLYKRLKNKFTNLFLNSADDLQKPKSKQVYSNNPSNVVNAKYLVCDNTPCLVTRYGHYSRSPT